MITRQELLEELLPGLKALFTSKIWQEKENKMKVTKGTMVRTLLRAGKTVKEITKALKVSPQFVYTQNWMMKGGDKKVKTNTSKKKMQLNQPKILLTTKPTPLTDFVREELANIERQIDNLNTIASFLAIRLRQMEQNGE